ncbi:hypothetical protein GCM10009117_01820 [Gangjinia marincola]|uniref:Probable endolytic peptidoglycan transglycosylase RlpA n=1 Tax=Gangjinia marincola TaxID=578463 RepID=A0ABP3XTW8_9FLAO
MQKTILSIILLFIVSTTFAQVQTGKTSFYANKFEGRKTASGVKYYHNKMTAAHRTLDFGTMVKVTNLANNKSVIVEVNDRGPFVRGRIIDLSKSAAQKLDFIGQGVTDVVVEVLDEKEANTVATKPAIVSSPTVVTTNSTTTAAVVEEKEFYELDVERVNPEGFGVQIGSFQESANLVRLANNLNKSYSKKVHTQVKIIQGVKVYTLVVGEFKDREKAEKFRKKLAKRYPGCFIIDFYNL